MSPKMASSETKGTTTAGTTGMTLLVLLLSWLWSFLIHDAHAELDVDVEVEDGLYPGCRYPEKNFEFGGSVSIAPVRALNVIVSFHVEVLEWFVDPEPEPDEPLKVPVMTVLVKAVALVIRVERVGVGVGVTGGGVVGTVARVAVTGIEGMEFVRTGADTGGGVVGTVAGVTGAALAMTGAALGATGALAGGGAGGVAEAASFQFWEAAAGSAE